MRIFLSFYSEEFFSFLDLLLGIRHYITYLTLLKINIFAFAYFIPMIETYSVISTAHESTELHVFKKELHTSKTRISGSFLNDT